MASKHITEYLKRNAQKLPHKPAIVDGATTLTWQDLWDRVQAGSQYLVPQLSRKKQEVVSLLIPNTWEYIVAYLSIVHAGHIAMPIDIIYKPMEIEAILHQIPSKFLITDQANKERISNTNTSVITVDELSSAREWDDKELLRIEPNVQVASLMFTSGTTGRPKAVPYTHLNHIWNIQVCSKVWGWDTSDTLLVSVRLSHMLGIVMGLSGVLYHGNTLYLQERFDAEETLKTLASGKITMFSHASMVYSKMLEVDRDFDLSKVRLCISGASPLPPAVWHEFKARFGQEILEVYGTTETGRIASNLPDERIPGSPGRPLPEVKLKFSPDGEVLIKSPGVFPGYYHNAEATKKARTADGWWRTGDIGALDGGRVILKGRLQERIIKYGYTISPRDIEWALHNNPKIKDVYVRGIQQPDSPNDQLVYYLVTSANENELLEYCKTNLPSVWRPDKIVFIDRIPRTRTGKPDLTKLLQMG